MNKSEIKKADATLNESFRFDKYPQKCIACGCYDDGSIEHPTTELNVKTKLCKKCFYTLIGR